MMLKDIACSTLCICLATFVANDVERSTGSAWYGRGNRHSRGFHFWVRTLQRSNQDGEK